MLEIVPSPFGQMDFEKLSEDQSPYPQEDLAAKSRPKRKRRGVQRGNLKVFDFIRSMRAIFDLLRGEEGDRKRERGERESGREREKERVRERERERGGERKRERDK